jgi:OOP family OmpA-OmpF porin
MKARLLFLVLPFLLLNNASAQTEKIFSGNDITESSLIQALTPAPDLKDSGVRTRGIRVNRENVPEAMTNTPAKTASASLLITFQTNSAHLTPDAIQKLNIVGQALSSDQLSNYEFLIQGHADPIGNQLANLKLSQHRAEAVRRYLVQTRHIEQERLEAIGKGDKEPLNTVNPAAPENRRVTIITRVK